MVEHRLARGAVMHVVAALHRERQVVAERARHDVGPGPECDDGFLGLQFSFDGLNRPAACLKRGRISLQEPAAPALEQLQVGEREALRIDHADRIGPVQRADEDGREVGFLVLQLLLIQC